MNKASTKQVGGDHYKSMAIQPSEFIERNGLSWHEGNAIKYICRHRLKGGHNDIDKAIHYLELLKELEYNKGETKHDGHGDYPGTTEPSTALYAYRAGCRNPTGECPLGGCTGECYAGKVGGGESQ